MYCRRIKIEKSWLSMENCIIDSPDTEFSFGLCPKCIEEQYGNVLGPERLKVVIF